ncbi:MAG: FAD binding domain-containing protein, partial [Quisquiliibacterium sp.]
MQPVELDQALMLLHQTPATVLAGGTDLFPSIAGAALPGPVLDLSQLQALRELSVLPAPGPSGQGTVQEYLRIGAALTWTDLLHADLPQGLEALRLAAREIGAGQIQNRATLGGNLCNASPAADSVPVLLALEAKVELRRQGGCRTLELADFMLGHRRTALASGDVMTAVLIPLPLAGSRSLFLKLGHRRYLVISAVSLAISACFDAQRQYAGIPELCPG